jgi:hypothetical protein
VSPPPPVEPVAGAAAIPAGARAYEIVAEESLLQILVYRGGAMARLGHNHVIASRHLSGTIQVTDDLTQTHFDIGFPVGELTVDEPVLREAAGPDFPPGVPQSARDGTRKNLLSEALLDAARYPEVRLRASGVQGTGDTFEVDVEITLKDQVRHVRVPLRVDRKPGSLTASGEFPLTQSELGLKPFSAAMGALLVIDEMRVRFEVSARE